MPGHRDEPEARSRPTTALSDGPTGAQRPSRIRTRYAFATVSSDSPERCRVARPIPVAGAWVALVGVLLFGASAHARSAADTCEASKLNTSGRYGACRLRAASKAVDVGATADFGKCDAKFAAKWAHAESAAAGQCPTDGDEAAIQALITQCTDDGVGPALAQDSEQDRESRVREAAMSFYAAFNSGFVGGADFAAEDWNHITPYGGWTQGRAITLALVQILHSPGFFLNGVIETVDDMSVRFATFNFAVVVATSSVTTYTTPDGVTHANTRERRTFVVVKRSGRWLVMLDQATIIGG